MSLNKYGVPLGGNLEGVRVIDFTVAMAGPICCGHMADMGAEVIRVERPQAQDYGRHIDPPTKEIADYSGAMYMWRSGGKKCVSLDMKYPEAVEVFKDLVRVSDIVVQNRTVGVMDRLGIGYEDLAKVNPRIIMCSMSGFGQTGPLAERPTYDLNIQALTGNVYIGGPPDGVPSPGWCAWVDAGSGSHAFGAIMAALYSREKTGRGQHLDVSMYEQCFTFQDYPLLEYLWSDGNIKRTRRGPYHPTLALYGVWECGDGYICMTASHDVPFRKLMDLLGRPELVTDPRFATEYARNEHWEIINPIVAEWLKGFAMEEALILLEENGLMCSPILSVGEAANHPHIAARNMIIEMEDPRCGKVKLPNSAFHDAGAKAELRKRPPFQGEHNEEILAGLMSYSQERLSQLYASGALYVDKETAKVFGR